MSAAMARAKIKICCMQSVDEARLAIAHGASALGLVSAMPSGFGVIDDDRIRKIAAAIPPGIASFLLTSARDADAIVAQQRACGVATLQLVDALPPGTHARLRRELPGVALVQVIHVQDEGAVDEARAVAGDVDALLLDSGNPGAAVPELGGTGRTHDWRISRTVVEAVDRPVYLAGGLRPDNVAAAVRQVRPYAVDVCTGVRIDGRLDPDRLAAFVAAAGEA